MGYARVASTDLEQWKQFAGKVLGLAEGRGPDPDNLYYRIDEVSARLVVFPSDKDELSCVGWELADHPALQEAREHLARPGSSSRRAPPRSSPSDGSRSWSGSPTPSTTSSSCSTASPTSRGPWSRRTPPRS